MFTAARLSSRGRDFDVYVSPPMEMTDICGPGYDRPLTQKW